LDGGFAGAQLQKTQAQIGFVLEGLRESKLDASDTQNGGQYYERKRSRFSLPSRSPLSVVALMIAIRRASRPA
jgi:hypothetical protein